MKKKSHYNKYICIALFFVALFTSPTYTQETQNTETALPGFYEYTLENGMQIYILEDYSSVPVRIEYTARAGYSAQTPKTAGFFQLYTKLFATAGKTAYTLHHNNETEQNHAWMLEALQAYCTSDSARYEITVSPTQVEQAIKQLSYCVLSPLFIDSDLQREFENLKESVMQNAFSTAGFINSSIDARIFATAPWKQESGIYPSLFSKTTLEQTRSILTNIERNYYAPKNSALFISGGIRATYILSLLHHYFTASPLPSLGAPSDDGKAVIKPTPQRKFVLHDRLFTKEMTQIVVQYTGLSLMQTNIAAATFNNRNSSIKMHLSETKELAIRDQEYINIAAAHKNGNSRLIVQSLLEKSKTNPVEQADTFVSLMQTAASQSTQEEYAAAKQRLISEYQTRFKSSSVFMEMLSQFWAVGTAQNSTQTIIQQLLSEPQLVQDENTTQLIDTYNQQEPYVFVLVNSDIYTKYAKAFKNAGYETVTTKNGSWYSQKLYEVLTTTDTTSEQQPIGLPLSAQAFARTNAQQFSTTTLSNGIPVIFKRNPTSTTVVLALTIAGGNLHSATTTPGLEEIIINALADNIHDGIIAAQSTGTITGIPEVTAQTNTVNGTITVECLPQDVHACLTCISQAIIYGTIMPARADGLLFNKQSTHRVEMGDPVYQLYSAAIQKLYHNTPYPALFDAQHDILQDVTYLSILQTYPSLLDAQRYSLILTGNIPDDDYKTLLEEQLGILKKQKDLGLSHTAQVYTGTVQQNDYPLRPDFSKTGTQKVSIEHRFFTDVTADKAGPRPEILVPTTEFLDPVQFWLPSPDPNSPDFERFNALLYALQNLLEAKQYIVRLIPASYEIQAATLTFVQVKHTKAVDDAYSAAVQEIKALLSPEDISNSINDQFIQNIKDTWIMQTLSQTQTNRGTTLLIQDSVNKTGNPTHYLNEYETIAQSTASDFITVLQQWILEQAPYRLYSKDAKK